MSWGAAAFIAADHLGKSGRDGRIRQRTSMRGPQSRVLHDAIFHDFLDRFSESKADQILIEFVHRGFKSLILKRPAKASDELLGFMAFLNEPPARRGSP